MSGVVLANASLDVAFHDKLLCYLSLPLTSKSNGKNLDKDLDNLYINIYTLYWIGIMDAVGSIQVNHNKRSNKLEYNFYFKLPPGSSAKHAISHFNAYTNGILKNENYNKKTKFYVFRINCDEKKFSNILDKIFNKSNFPYTSRLSCQISFAQDCLKHGKKWYYDQRKYKYSDQNRTIENKSEENSRLHLRKYPFFPYWLSGFLHGKSDWKVLGNIPTISVKNLDIYIAEEIQYYLGMTSKPDKNKRGNYSILIRNKKSLTHLKDHLSRYITLDLELLVILLKQGINS